MSHFSTNSEDPNERIQARRNRIDKRILLLKGEQLVTEEKERDDSGIKHQVAESEDVLERLTFEGQELVSSVAVAGATREVSRRERESREDTARAERLADEAASAARQLSDITDKWLLADGQCDVLELHNLLLDQTRRCEELTKQKEGVAETLRCELADRDDQYEMTIREQDEELALAGERVDSHVMALQHAHRAEIALLEAVIESTRSSQVGGGESRWSELWSSLQETQRQNDELRGQLCVSLAHNEDALHEEMAEQVHSARVKLQQLTQALGLELQGLRASCTLNAEKMKLNTELLRSRDQEARVVRAAQKRRINKLQDKLRALQSEVRVHQSENIQRRQILRDKVKHLTNETREQPHTSVAEVQLKMIATHGAKQSVKLVKQILAVDEVLHLEQLCLPWQRPHKLESRLSSVALSVSECKSVPGTESNSSSTQALNEACALLHFKDDGGVPERAVQHTMLAALLENSQFLSPEHPEDNLEKMSEEQKVLVKLADCLSALGVETETDLHSLFSTLRVHTRCEQCNQQPFLSLEENDEVECELHKCDLQNEDVLSALKHFTAARAVQSYSDDPVVFSPAQVKRLSKGEEIKDGWEQFTFLLPEHMESIWDTLQDGLVQHLAVLQDRHELNTQVGKLQAQNLELRRLLQSHVINKPRGNTKLT